jgi:hypothetical protein
METDKRIDHIVLLRPNGEKGTSIPFERYHSIKEFILNLLNRYEEITLAELLVEAEYRYGQSNKDVFWDLTNVKLDLEARGLLQVKVGQRTQLITSKKVRVLNQV